MRWGSFIARTAVRRVVWILVGLVVYGLLSVFAPARASDHQTRTEAWQHCMAEAHAVLPILQQNAPQFGYHSPGCRQEGTRRYQSTVMRANGTVYGLSQLSGHSRDAYHRWVGDCPPGTEFSEISGQCETPCGSRPTHHGRPPFLPASPGDRGSIPSGTAQCMNGCVYLWSGNVDLGFEGQPINQQCSGTLPPCGEGILGAMGYVSSPLGCTPPPPPECAANQVKDPVTGTCGNACPAGMKLNERNECVPDNNKCPAGQTKAPDGSCTDNACPAGSAKGKDGTCKPDGDGDGNPDDEGGNEDGNTFSGGESCDVGFTPVFTDTYDKAD